MNDERIIRKKYGEEMWHFCRDNFSTILEKPGKLSNFLLETFNQSHYLFIDLLSTNQLDKFKNIIYDKYDNEKEEEKTDNILKTPTELLDEAGYILYECKSEEDIQAFKKYYEKNEILCTITNKNRLNTCYVFFAVKKDVDKIIRKDYKTPKRQDKYGTSVISIQFTKDGFHRLSIKNRYNHTVSNPDATFSNDLDNIISGLTESFEKYYGMKQKLSQGIELDGYVLDKNGKYYKYNYEINNIYYCDNNIIIDNFNVIDEYKDKSRYLIIDYFIIDLKEKKISLYDKWLTDDFINVENDIKNISIKNNKEEKIINISHDNGTSEIIVDKYNRIISYKNNYEYIIEKNFLYYNKELQEISLPNVISIGYAFLYYNEELQEISLPNVTSIGDAFLCYNEELQEISLPNVTSIGDDFLYYNKELQEISLPNVIIIGDHFICYNRKLKKINIPLITNIGIISVYINSLIKNQENEKIFSDADDKDYISKNDYSLKR